MGLFWRFKVRWHSSSIFLEKPSKTVSKTAVRAIFRWRTSAILKSCRKSPDPPIRDVKRHRDSPFPRRAKIPKASPPSERQQKPTSPKVPTTSPLPSTMTFSPWGKIPTVPSLPSITTTFSHKTQNTDSTATFRTAAHIPPKIPTKMKDIPPPKTGVGHREMTDHPKLVTLSNFWLLSLCTIFPIST